jgi:predicted ferric reductase
LYFVYFLGISDPDLIKSKIFLRFDEFRKAFIILAVVGFALVFHVFFIYLPKYISMDLWRTIVPWVGSLQQLLGLVLTILLLLFVYKMFRTVK